METRIGCVGTLRSLYGPLHQFTVDDIEFRHRLILLIFDNQFFIHNHEFVFQLQI